MNTTERYDPDFDQPLVIKPEANNTFAHPSWKQLLILGMAQGALIICTIGFFILLFILL